MPEQSENRRRALHNGFLSLAICIVTFAKPYPTYAQQAQMGTCSESSGAPSAVETALNDVLKQVIDSPLGSAPGAVLSVHAGDWQYIAATGFADPSAATPIDCAMPFQIGSNTKMMTSVVLLQLMEEGRLGIDDLLSMHLPEFAARLPHGEAITLRHLAQHTSGIFSYTDNAPDGTPGLMEGATTSRDALVRPLEPQEMVDFVIEHGEPNFPPGAEGSWSYSNTGYVLLGMVIEKLEKKPIGKSFETRIFGPLGMNKTYLWNGIPRPEFGLPRSFLEGDHYETTDWNMTQGWAAGALISTVDDMHTFIEALVAGELFQQPETLSEMMDTIQTTHPALAGYGLGLAMKGDNLWGHGGQTLGFESEVAAFADRDMSIVAWATSSSNALGFGALLISDALRKAGALPE